MTDKDYDRIFGIKKSNHLLKTQMLTEKRFLKTRRGKTNKD